MDNNDEKENTPPLLLLPPEVLELILRYTDANSVINLANSCTVARSKVFEALGYGTLAMKYWASECRKFYQDREMLNVLASFDTFMNVEDGNINDDNCKGFMWKDVCLLAHDLHFRIQNSNPQIRNLSKLEGNIKEDFCYSQPVIQPDEDEETYPLRPRLTGCSGSFAWTSIFRWSSEILMVYESMENCRKIISTPNGHRKNILQIEVINFPRSAKEPSHEEMGVRKVFPVLIILCDKCVLLAHLQDQEDVCQEIPFSPYEFDRNYMKPMMAIHKNYLAIWSQPYDLKIYELSVGRNPNNPDRTYLHYQALITLNNDNTDHLGSLWQNMATSLWKNTYFFSFNLQEIVDVNFTAQGERDGRIRPCKFELMVTSPFDETYRAKIKLGGIVEHPLDSEKQFSFNKNKMKPNLYSSNLLSTSKNTIGKKSFQDVFKQSNMKTTMGYDLFIVYTENALVFSANATNWFIDKLEDFMMVKQNQRKNFQHIFNIKIIAKNMIAIFSNNLISIVEPIVPTPIAEFSCNDNIMEVYSSTNLNPSLHLRIIKQIQVDIMTSMAVQIPQVYFGYNKGIPYLWFEICDSIEEKRGNDNTTATTTAHQYDSRKVEQRFFLPHLQCVSCDNSTTPKIVASPASISGKEANDFEKSLMNFQIFCIDFNQDLDS